MAIISNDLVNLYKTVLEREKDEFNVRHEAIRNAIRVMNDAYQPNSSWNLKSNYTAVNYNKSAFRCAYLHKYAMCYTGMVFCLIQLAIDNSDAVFSNFNRTRYLNLCSLGGGPGTDIVGAVAALISRDIDLNSWSAVIVDLAGKWRLSFTWILNQLQYRALCFRKMRQLFSSASYLEANLLEDWSSNPNIGQAIMYADVVLMVKFISAAACNYRTENMVKKVFMKMKPGAMLIFIDNAAGGFGEMVKRKASECGLISIYGPLLHYEYEDSTFSISRFGSKSQSKSRVVFEVYQKPALSLRNTTQPLYPKWVCGCTINNRHTAQPRYYYEPESYIQRRPNNENYQNVFIFVLVCLITLFLIYFGDKFSF